MIVLSVDVEWCRARVVEDVSSVRHVPTLAYALTYVQAYVKAYALLYGIPPA